jgi:capsid protein
MFGRVLSMLGLMGSAGAAESNPVRHAPPYLRPGTLEYWAAYEAARPQRTDPDFMPSGLGVNALAEAFGGRDLIVRRMRHLADNNELVDGAAHTRCDNIVGTGIDDCEPDTGFTDLDEQIAKVWEWAVRRVDPERDMALWESQRLFEREITIAGEMLVHYPVAAAFRGWPAMPAVELIETERIPSDLTGVVPQGMQGAGNRVRQGVEYDAKDRVVAYHVLVANPRDNDLGPLGTIAFGGANLSHYLGSASLKRIPVEDCELAFVPRRSQQLRGVPRGMTAVRTVRTEAGFTEDSMGQARLAATLGVFFAGEHLPVNLFQQKDGTQAASVDARGNPIMTLARNVVGFLRGKTELKTVGGNLPGPNFVEAVAVLFRRIARAFGVNYASFSGDSSKTTFSSMRGESLDARKGYRPEQRFVWEHHTEPWRRRLIDWAVMTGRVKLTLEQMAAVKKDPDLLYRCEVGYPGWEYVNPAQEAMAAGEDIANGVRSEVEIIQERGGSWKRTVRQRAKYRKFQKEEFAKAGVPEPADPNAPPPAPPPGGENEDEETGEPRKGEGPRESRLRRMGLAAALESSQNGEHDRG